MIDPDVGMTFVDFVEARHQVWERRQAGEPGPWTTDPIIASRKFTNVFRVLDYGSQFLLRELLEPDLSPVDTLMRCFLYRHTNLPSAWDAYREDTGGYPLLDSLDDLLDFWTGFRLRGGQVFSGAYMIYPQSATPGTDKAESIIRLTQRLFIKEGLATDFLMQDKQIDRFGVLRRNKGVADFMSMQILTDWGYSQFGEDLEDEFVVPGPGARKGAAHLDPKVKAEQVIEWAVEAIRSSPGCPELPLDGYGENYRAPSYMDAQNCLCEFSKYVRYEGKPHPNAYNPAHPGTQQIVLPKHW